MYTKEPGGLQSAHKKYMHILKEMEHERTNKDNVEMLAELGYVLLID